MSDMRFLGLLGCVEAVCDFVSRSSWTAMDFVNLFNSLNSWLNARKTYRKVFYISGQFKVAASKCQRYSLNLGCGSFCLDHAWVFQVGEVVECTFPHTEN